MGFIGNAVGSVVGGITGGAAQGMTTTNSYRASDDFSKQWGQQYDNLNQNYADQQNLADQLRMQMNGMGPNIAQGQFQQALNQNTANTAGAISSQKGISPALATRMIAQNSAAAGQNAAAQSAQLDAQQRLAATQALQQQQAQMANQSQGTLGAFLNAQMTGQGINAGVTGSNQAAINKTQQGIHQGISSLLSSGAGAGSGGAGSAMAGAPSGAGSLGSGMMLASSGALVPGEANVPGDHPANDTVPALLSPGEIVVPRSIAHDSEKAKKFIDHINAEQSDKVDGYAKVLAARKKLADLEAKFGGK